MQQTPIGWTDFSSNLLKYINTTGDIVWACVHASEGCRFCYSEALAKRWGRGENWKTLYLWNMTETSDIDERT
jgi:protein gp37